MVLEVRICAYTKDFEALDFGNGHVLGSDLVHPARPADTENGQVLGGDLVHPEAVLWRRPSIQFGFSRTTAFNRLHE